MLTRRQRDFHLALADLADELGRAPSYREAARLAGMRLSAVQRLAERLRDRGVVAPGSLALLRRPDPPAEIVAVDPRGGHEVLLAPHYELTGEGQRALIAFRGAPASPSFMQEDGADA